MTTPPIEPQSAAGSWRPLEATQRRVLGVLIEKAKTTPAAYPMTLNALVTGCNQKNNREPLTSLDDTDVANALRGLEAHRVVSEIDWMGRSSKYKHHAYDWMAVSKSELAVMTELLLRGEQTLGDLRARAARMEPIADLTELKPIVDALVQRGLMIELTPPGRGQIVSHNLYLPQERAELEARLHRQPLRPEQPRSDDLRRPREAGPTPAADDDSLEQEVEQLRAQVIALEERIASLEQRMEQTGF